MFANKIAAVVVASILLISGAAVGGVAGAPVDLPGQADEKAGEHVPDEPGDVDPPIEDPANASNGAVDERANMSGVADDHPNASNDAGEAASTGPPVDRQNASEDRPGAVGPPDGLPEQAADHVSDVHETIESFLNGQIEHLGEALSELLGEDDNGADADEDDNDDDGADDDA